MDGEAAIKRQSDLGPRSCLLRVSHHRQGTSEVKVRKRVIGIGFNAPAKPVECLKVGFGHQLGHPDKHEPKKGARIARGQSQRILNVPLYVLATLQCILSKPDEPMCIG